MRTSIFLALAGFSLCHGATLTVCASGCLYADFQTALNAAARGDVIELKAGEVFEGAFQLPYKAGAGFITVRSSRWRELPPPGTRVTAADSVLMPKVQPNHQSAVALLAGFFERHVSNVNLSTDTLTFSSAHGLSNGEPFACRRNNDGVIPIGLNQIYYARDVTATTLRLSDTVGGPAVDLVTPQTATDFRCVSGRSIGYWRFTGIEFRKKPGQTTEYNLIQIGAEETSRQGLPHHIEMDRVYIHGIQNENGPRICLLINAAHLSITDSRFEHCNKESEEGKAIGTWMMPGPAVIRNNYLASGSIVVLFGGSFIPIYNLVNGDTGGILIEGNHFTRPLWTKYSAGAGGTAAPTGSCSEGARYLNTATGQWYLCNSSSAWAAGPLCADGEYFRQNNVTQSCAGGACWSCSGGVFTPSSVYRGSGYATKNLFEIKSAKDVVVRGNIFENNWVNSDQSGVAVWITSQVAQYNANGWVRGENIRFERNIIRNSSQGIRLAQEGSTAFGVNNNRLQVRDNLIYNIGNTAYPTINSRDARPLTLAGHCDDCVVEHNTIVSGVSGGTGMSFDTFPLTRPRLANNILYANQYGILGDLGLPISYYAGTGNITNSVAVDNLGNGTGNFGPYATNGKFIGASVPLFTGGGNYRLLPNSPYAAACTTGCDYTGTDGKDIGADVDLVEASTSGADTGAPALERIRIRVDAGSRFAVVHYTAPGAAACALSLFTTPGRTQLHADTTGAGNQADTRAGSLSSGRTREFVLGTVSQLTPSTLYYARLDCGGLRIPFEVRTRAAGGLRQHELRLAQARSVQYANNAAFSSPVQLPSGTRHLIPVAAESVVYMRIADLPATAIAGH